MCPVRGHFRISGVNLVFHYLAGPSPLQCCSPEAGPLADSTGWTAHHLHHLQSKDLKPHLFSCPWLQFALWLLFAPSPAPESPSLCARYLTHSEASSIPSASSLCHCSPPLVTTPPVASSWLSMTLAPCSHKRPSPLHPHLLTPTLCLMHFFAPPPSCCP